MNYLPLQRSMPPLVTSPLVMIDVIYSLGSVTTRQFYNTFLNSPRKNNVEDQVEFTLKLMERARETGY